MVGTDVNVVGTLLVIPTIIGNLFPVGMVIHDPADYYPFTLLRPLAHSSWLHMALASTRLSFFERYEFGIRNGFGIYDEFERLARARNWRQGSRSRKYDKAWRECFGEDVPVGIMVEGSDVKGQEEDGLASLLSDLEGLDLQGRRGGKREERLRHVARQFTTYYGMDDRALESWQALCQDCGIDGYLASKRECKKVNVRASRGRLLTAIGVEENIYQYS